MAQNTNCVFGEINPLFVNFKSSGDRSGFQSSHFIFRIQLLHYFHRPNKPYVMKTLFLAMGLLAPGILFFDNAGQPERTTRPPAAATALFKGPASPADTNLTLFARGLYPGDDSTFEQIRNSGFTTLILSSFYIKANGDLYSGDDGKNPIIHDGKYVGDKQWLKRVATLKKGNSSISRIEILFEGRWYNQPPNTFDFIQDWTDPAKVVPGITTGTGKKSALYKICKALKDAVGADAICIDDESVYNSASIVELGKMIGRLNMHMTLCPYKNADYWKTIITGSDKGLIDAIYIQCYDGGARNTTGPWVKSLGAGIPLYPIFLCRGAFSTCATSHNSKTPDEIKAEMIRFKKEYPGMTGGAIWQMADIKGFVRRGCAMQDTTSGNATSVTEYLSQLKNSLKEGL